MSQDVIDEYIEHKWLDSIDSIKTHSSEYIDTEKTTSFSINTNNSLEDVVLPLSQICEEEGYEKYGWCFINYTESGSIVITLMKHNPYVLPQIKGQYMPADGFGNVTTIETKKTYVFDFDYETDSKNYILLIKKSTNPTLLSLHNSDIDLDKKDNISTCAKNNYNIKKWMLLFSIQIFMYGLLYHIYLSMF